MKKIPIFIVLMVCVLVAGFFWVDSMLSLPDANCLCRNHSNMMERCQANCYLNWGVFCEGIITEPYGTCIDQTCWTFFNYLCDNGKMSTDLSDYKNCIDCYEN